MIYVLLQVLCMLTTSLTRISTNSPVMELHGAIITIGEVLVLVVGLSNQENLQDVTLLVPVIRGHGVAAESESIHAHSWPEYLEEI